MSARKLVQEEFAGEQTDVEATAATVQAAEAIATGKPATTTRPKADQPFDPIQYLSNFNGKDYLEVKWRVMWLRHEHPDARMTTEIVQHNEEGGFALFRAEVEIPGGGKATGWGSETIRDFHDYIEAAETKAIGRALAGLGYGTQFCADFDFTANARPGTAQVVDAPVNLSEPRNIVSANRPSPFPSNGNANGSAKASSNIRQGAFGNSGFTRIEGGKQTVEEDDFDRSPEVSAAGSALTDKQLKAIYAIGRASKRLSEQQVDDRCAEIFGVRANELTKAEASQFIDMLKGEAA